MATTLPVGYANITPRLIVVDDANGNTLTRATIRGFTKQDLEDQNLQEVGMARIIANAKEARLAGVKENALIDLLMSRFVSLKESRAAAQGSIIQPFEFFPRRNIVNANYFQVVTGAAHPSAGSGGIPGHAWQITLKIGGSRWNAAPSNSPKSLEKYFLPQGNIIVEYLDSSNNARVAQFKIVDSVNANSGSTEQAKITVEPNISFDGANGWGSLSTAQKAVWQPTAGQVTKLANSISDYESYGFQHPATNNYTMVEYWNQRQRWADSYTSEYVAALKNPNGSEFFRKFYTTPLAEQKRQREMIVQGERFESFFWQDRINELQSTASNAWQSLPKIYDPADDTFQVEIKANTLGCHTQLNEAGMVSDRLGQPLDLDAIFDLCYDLCRIRGSQNTSGGDSVDTVDCMTDRLTAEMIDSIMIRYYQARYSSQSQFYYQPGQKLTFNGAYVMGYNKYYIPKHGVWMAVFPQRYFDDRILNFTEAQKSVARFFWMLDWSDVSVNLLDTASRNISTDVAAELYRYTIKQNVKFTKLNSMYFQVRVGDPNRHRIFKNFSDAPPVLRAPVVGTLT